MMLRPFGAAPAWSTPRLQPATMNQAPEGGGTTL
jgi:hypothetical protein